MSMYNSSSSFPASATSGGGGGVGNAPPPPGGGGYPTTSNPAVQASYPPQPPMARGTGFGGGGANNGASAGAGASGLDQGKIFVGGLSWQTTEESLLFHFQQYGPVTNVELMKDRNTGKPRGFGFVCFADPSTVDLVMQEQHEVCHKIVDVKRAQARGVAPPSIHQDRQQQQQLQPQSPPIMGPSAAPVGGEAAHQQQQQQAYMGGGTKSRFMMGGGGVGGQQQDMTPEQMHCKVFVGGIPHSVDRDELRHIMSQFGTVVDSIIMVDQVTMRSRGFGFITFSEAAAAERSIAVQPINIQGKMVEVKLATPRPDRDPNAPAGSGGGIGAAGKPAFLSGLGGGAGAPMNNNMNRTPTGTATYPNRFLGLRAGQQVAGASNSEYAGFAVAYGRSGWKAGFGSRAFGRHGWNVQGWDDDDDEDNNESNDDKNNNGGAKQAPASVGFSFAMLHDDEEGDEDGSQPSKRPRLSSAE